MHSYVQETSTNGQCLWIINSQTSHHSQNSQKSCLAKFPSTRYILINAMNIKWPLWEVAVFMLLFYTESYSLADSHKFMQSSRQPPKLLEELHMQVYTKTGNDVKSTIHFLEYITVPSTYVLYTTKTCLHYTHIWMQYHLTCLPFYYSTTLLQHIQCKHHLYCQKCTYLLTWVMHACMYTAKVCLPYCVCKYDAVHFTCQPFYYSTTPLQHVACVNTT